MTSPDGSSASTPLDGHPAGLLDRLLLPSPGRVLGNLKVGHDAEVVAGPDAVHRPVEGPKAPGHVEAWPVHAAADHHVVDPPTEFQRHLAGTFQGVERGEGVAGSQWARGFPRIAVRNADPVQGLAPG